MQSEPQHTENERRFEGKKRAEKPALKIVIMFETVRAGERARMRVERLLKDMKAAPEVETDLWGFDEVSQPELCKQAGTQARDADILLLSAEGTSLPVPMVDFIEHWLPRKSAQQGALVALLGENKPAPGQLSEAGEYLRQKAQATGREFFCEIAPGQGQGSSSSSLSSAGTPGGDSHVTWVDTPEGLANQGFGIND